MTSALITTAALVGTAIALAAGLSRLRGSASTSDDEALETHTKRAGGRPLDERALARATARVPIRPPDHYWLIEGKLAGGPWPTRQALDWMAAEGFTDLVNLTESSYSDSRFAIHQIPIADMDAPAQAQISVFCRMIDEVLSTGRKAYVHCVGGIGRTGTMMACLLVQRERMPRMDAIRRVRSLRLGSVESTRQEDAVTEWEAGLERDRG